MCEGPLDRLAFDTAAVGQSDRRQRVEHVVPAGDGHADARHFPAPIRDPKFGGGVVPTQYRPHTNRNPASGRKFRPGKTPSQTTSFTSGLSPQCHDAAAPRHQIHQAAKLQRDRCQIRDRCPRDRIRAK